ncbi:MAG TPA: hybrid sensor histidine kinase/response regulator, partial [Idiomarina sp.]|nr:hybrid sensor histidine kinase/response regulator [Idiomarina sp.]
ERSLAAGMQGHIAKPINEDQLLKAIVKWCVPGEYSAEPADDAADYPVADTATQTKVRYPQTKGIDFDTALARLGNNVELYLKLVAQLHEQYQNSAMKVSDFITRGQHDSARRYFHSLKGAAGNLGLESLQAKAGELEKFMAEGNIDKVADQITVLEKRLQHAHQAASDLDAIQHHQ